MVFALLAFAAMSLLDVLSLLAVVTFVPPPVAADVVSVKLVASAKSVAIVKEIANNERFGTLKSVAAGNKLTMLCKLLLAELVNGRVVTTLPGNDG